MLVDKTGLLRNGNNGAERIKEVHEEKNEDDVEEPETQGTGYIELKSRRRHSRPVERRWRPGGETCRHSDRRGGQHANQNRSRYSARLQRSNQE